MPNFPDVDQEIPPNAVRVIDNTAEDFPILKAFQTYVDAEQSKARKRMLALSIFFGILLTVVIGVFMAILHNVSGQNQQLNDRLVEYLMKDRDRQSAAVVVQPPPQVTDNSAILAKMDELQKKIELEAATRKAAEEAAIKAAELAAKQPKGPTPEEVEIARLKALLEAERQKAEDDREKRREEELERYRRKYYPEFYETPKSERVRPQPIQFKEDNLDKILEDLNDDAAISYFDEPKPSARQKNRTTTPSTPTYSIPVEVNGSRGSWRIPE